MYIFNYIDVYTAPQGMCDARYSIKLLLGTLMKNIHNLSLLNKVSYLMIYYYILTFSIPTICVSIKYKLSYI